MIPFFTCQTGYSSCIKVAGIPILPPLITDERRSELIEDKAKAIEIEKRIKRKRTSIDSGVMTGSYIDNFKNSETLLAETSVYNDISISDLTLNENIQHSESLSPENATSDNFLKSALEDSEFREFFYSAAERIFKDNYMLNENRNHNSSVLINNHSPDNNGSNDNEQTKTTEIIKELSQITIQPSNQNYIVDGEVSDNIIHTSTVENNKLNAFHEATNTTTEGIENQPSLPPERPVRRNSYTLDSPSPVLLEHMSKGIISKEQISDNWIELSAKKEECKGVGFRTCLSTKKQRKTWTKKDDNHSASSHSSVDDFPNSKVPTCLLKKSKTFVRTQKHYEDLNYSLPCSSRSSPTHSSNFVYSSDCIQSDSKKLSDTINKNFELNLSNTCKHDKEEKGSQQQENSFPYENTILTVTGKDSRTNFEDSDKELNDALSVKNDSVILHPNYEMLVLYPAQDMPRNSNINNHSCIYQSHVPQKISDYSKLSESRIFESKRDHSNEIDDTASLCSSLSLSKFMPVDDNLSRPSTAEDLSSLFSELQLRHERQIAELLDMQRKEKVMLSQLHSNHGTISSQSTTNLSVSEFSFDHNNFFPVSDSAEKRTQCSRELFPTEINRSPPKEEKRTDNHHYYNSETEKVAALKLTACVRGYLTRRLLKTEKVQQLIDTIKESLNCAFSLQSETELRKNDLDLHERLAHQLTSALYELQSIISAPVATRMAIIATDREKLRKPVSRPSSAISSATQKAILRRQKSMNISEKKSQDNNNRIQEIRPRAKSLCLLGTSGTGSNVKSDSSTSSANNSRKPWR